MWEVSWRLNRTATYCPPNSSGYSSISFPFSWAVQTGAWGPSLNWDMVLIPASSLQLIWTSCRRGYMIIWRPPTSCERHMCTQFNRRQSRSSPDSLISSTGYTCSLHRYIYHLTARPGRRSVCYTHKNPSLRMKCIKSSWNLRYKTDYQIPASRPDLVLISKKKENLLSSDFVVP